MKKPFLKCARIGFSAGSKLLLKPTQLTCSHNEHIVLAGLNGCGKSTLLRCLTGEVSHVRDIVFIGGKTLSRMSAKERAQEIGFLSQQRQAPFPISVIDFVSFGLLHAEPKEKPRLLERAIQACDLIDHVLQDVRSLSGGEWQRCRLARIIAQDSKLWLLDEPTTSLDIKAKKKFWQILKDVCHNRAVIVATHDIEGSKTFADTYWLFENQKIDVFENRDISATSHRFMRAFDLTVSDFI